MQKLGDRSANELVIRIQPDEAIYLKINNKVPGLGMRLNHTKLDLQYKAAYDVDFPDAYERLTRLRSRPGGCSLGALPKAPSSTKDSSQNSPNTIRTFKSH